MSIVTDKLATDERAESDRIARRLARGIREQLKAFHQIRRSNRMFSGVSGWVVFTLTTLFACILIDAVWVAPNARWVASGIFYLTVGAGGWFLVVRRWMNVAPDWIAEARLLERRSGRVRNLLVAAVELASRPLPSGTSGEFASRVQDDAEEAIESLDIRDVVPRKSRRKAMRQLQIACAVTVFACLLPWVHVPSRIARVLFPIANLGRSSWVTIAVTQPLPHSKNIAQGEIVVVEAEFSGPWQGVAILETRSPDAAASPAMIASSESMISSRGQSMSAVPMQGGDSRARGTLTTDNAWIEYRVTGQHAATPWYRMNAFPRPAVETIVAIVSPPIASSGTRIPDYTTSFDANQKMEVLRGSRVRLKLTTNLPPAIADLEWLSGTTPRSGEAAHAESGAIESEIEDSNAPSSSLMQADGSLKMEATVKADARFRIHLVDADNALSNAFDRPYEIDVIDDGPPELEWIAPEATDHLITRDQLFEFHLRANDELRLSELELRWRSNGSAWKFIADANRSATAPAGSGLNRQEQIAASVDFIGLDVKYGDLIEITGRAVDSSGQETISRSQRMTVVASKSQAVIGSAEELQFDIANRIDEFATKVEHYEDGPARQSLRALEIVTGLRADLQQLIGFSLSTAGDSGSEEGKMAVALVGAALADKNAEFALHSARLEEASVDSVESRDDVKRIAAGLREVNKHFRSALSVQVLRSIADSVKIIADAQLEIQDSLDALADAGSQQAEAPNSTQPNILALTRQQRAVYFQVEHLQQLITDAASRVDSGMSPVLAEVANRLDSAANGSRRDIRDTNIRTLSHSASQLSNELQRYQTVYGIHSDWAPDLVANLSGLAKINQAASTANRLAQMIGDTRESDTEYLTVAFGTRYRVGRSFQRATQPGAGRLASDLGSADRATRSQAELLSGRQLALQLRRIESAAQLLRADASARAMHQLTKRIGSLRDTADTARSLDQSWCGCASRFSTVADSVRRSSLAADLLPRLDRVTNLVRNSPIRALSKAPGRSHAATIDRQLLEILPGLEIEARRARAFLKSLSPSVVKLAETAAKQTQELALVTSDLAGATKRNTAASVEAEVRQLASQLADRSESVDDLRDALVDIAESQDLLDADGIAASKQADRAREQVDVAREQVQNSLASVDLSAAERELAQQLRSGAEQQQAAADRLEQVAEQLRNSQLAEEDSANGAEAGEATEGSQSNSGADGGSPGAAANKTETDSQTSQGSTNRPSDPTPPAESDSQVSENEQAYSDAESLAEFAAETPEDMLAKLEAYLPTSKPMQRELSSIAQEALADAIEDIAVARRKYQQLASGFVLSDIDAEVRSAEAAYEIEFASAALRDTSAYLLSQSRAASALSGNNQIAGALQSEHALIAAELADLQNRSREMNRAIALPSSRANLLAEYEAIAKSVSELWQTHHARLQESQAKPIHASDRDLRTAKQDASDRLRRATQYLGRTTLSQKRIRDRHLGNTTGRIAQLKTEVERAKKDMLAKSSVGKPEIAKKAARRLAWRKAQLDAYEAFSKRLEAKAEVAQAEVETVNQLSSLQTASDNPAAGLALRLLDELSRSSRVIAAEVGKTMVPIAAPRIAEHALDANRNVPDAAAEILKAASGIIERATRHESRLANSDAVIKLQDASRGISNIIGNRTQQSNIAMQAAQLSIGEVADGSANPGRATTITSRDSIGGAMSLAADAIELEKLLAGLETNQPWADHPLATPRAPAKPPLPMRPDELANLLDQLDRQLNEESSLGERDNDSSGAPSSPSPPQQLSQTASQIAQSLAKGRRTPTQQTSGDLATATESQQADVRPQGPTAVQMLDVQRLNGQWGELRQQTTDDAVENARAGVPAQYRSQVDAYFRALGNKADAGEER